MQTTGNRHSGGIEKVGDEQKYLCRTGFKLPYFPAILSGNAELSNSAEVETVKTAFGPGPLMVQRQLPGHDGWQMVGVILQEHGISIEFDKEAAGWEAMAQEGLRKLEAFETSSTGTPHEQFNIEHTRLYIDVCRRFASEPDLVDLKAWNAVAEQFVIDGGKLAERFGVQL